MSSSFYGALSVQCTAHPYRLHSSTINKLAVRHFVCCFGAYGLLSQCLGKAVADTRPFDPHYFPLQTIDFNYQTALSATASSSACVPRKCNCWRRQTHQPQYGSLFVSLWICSADYYGREFDGVLSLFFPLCLKGDTVTAGFLCLKRPLQVTIYSDEHFKGSVRVSVMYLWG